MVDMRLLLAVSILAAVAQSPAQRPRARDLGIAPGVLEPGPLNAITDVGGVLVGQTTIVEGDTVRTGVTAVIPHGGNLFRDKVTGAVFVGNAFGKLAGSTQVHELGTIETPIVLTNTLSVGTAMEAVVRWTLDRPGNADVRSVNALVGETNDGGLNDIRGLHVTREQVLAAIDNAKAGPVAEGAVGAGTGTIAFGWKGGIGTSSRRVRVGAEIYTIGVLVQTNYGGRLTIAGVPVWKELSPNAERRPPNAAQSDLSAAAPPAAQSDLSAVAPPAAPADLSAVAPPAAPADLSAVAPPAAPADLSAVAPQGAKADGSCMIIVATDAPLDARNLERVAARAVFALARTGSTYSNGSGDFAVAFSTLRPVGAPPSPIQQLVNLHTDAMSGLFEATLDATEEAVYNSLLAATTTTGNGRTVPALPIESLKATLKKFGR